MTNKALKTDVTQSFANTQGQTISRRVSLQVGLGISAMATFGMAEKRVVGDDANGSDTPLHYWSLKTLGQRIRAREISSVEVTRRLLDRIAVVDKNLKSYQLVTAAEALAAAENCDREIADGKYRGPLHGVPIGIKDLLYTRGIATTAGMQVRANFRPAFDATVVSRLTSAGAVSLGKLALCEGAMEPYHPDLSVPVNPWDASKWSGVSSSGSGVATAAGLCYGSIGTDTGGSIRYPSACNSCVGLKPTYGRVSRHGVFALADSMDHVGPMTRTVEDAAIMFEAMAGHDPLDRTTSRLAIPRITTMLSQSIKGMRIGLDRDYVTKGVDPEVTQALLQAVDVLASLGAKIIKVKMPADPNPSGIWFTIASLESVLANKDVFPAKAASLGPGFRETLEIGSRVTAFEYADACRQRREISCQIHNMLAEVDCLVCPSLSNPPRDIDPHPTLLETAEWERLSEQDVFTKPFNFSGVPTLSVPCGFSKSGLPMSLQFVASSWREADICRTGHAYQVATRWHQKHPNVATASA